MVNQLTFVHCVLLSHIGLTVAEAAAAEREWDIRTDPVVRNCTARMTELARRQR